MSWPLETKKRISLPKKGVKEGERNANFIYKIILFSRGEKLNHIRNN